MEQPTPRFEIDLNALIAEAAKKESTNTPPEQAKAQIAMMEEIMLGKTIEDKERKFLLDMKYRIRKGQKLTPKQGSYLGSVLLKLKSEPAICQTDQ